MTNFPFYSLLMMSLLIGCAHQQSTVNLPGAWKVDSGKLSTGMPNYPLSQEVFKEAEKHLVKRAPASTDQELADALEKAEAVPSLNRLYFKALYHQWRQLAKIHGRSSDLGICPQYHHDKTLMDEEKVDTQFQLVGVRPAAEDLPYYPEWALNIKTAEGVRSVWSTRSPKLVSEAVHHHGKKLLKELRVLCEEGSSDAYFRLENIVSYVVDKEEYKTATGLQALLKIPVFSTMLLMKAIEGKGQPGFSTYEQDLLNYVKAYQLQHYIVELKSRRKQHVTGAL